MINATVSELTAAYKDALDMLMATGFASRRNYLDLDEFLAYVTAPDFDSDKAWGYSGWSSQNFRKYGVIEPLSIAYLLSCGDRAYWWLDDFGELTYADAADNISVILCDVCDKHGVDPDDVEFDVDDFLFEASACGYNEDIVDACDMNYGDVCGRGYDKVARRIEDMIDWTEFESDDE